MSALEDQESTGALEAHNCNLSPGFIGDFQEAYCHTVHGVFLGWKPDGKPPERCFWRPYEQRSQTETPTEAQASRHEQRTHSPN